MNMSKKWKNRPNVNKLASAIGRLLNYYSIEPITFASWKNRIYINHSSVQADIRGYLKVPYSLTDEEAESFLNKNGEVYKLDCCELKLCVWIECPDKFMSEGDKKIYVSKARKVFKHILTEMKFYSYS